MREKKKMVLLLGIELLLLIYSIGIFMVPLKEYQFEGKSLVSSYGAYLEDFFGKYGNGCYIDDSIHADKEALAKLEDGESETVLLTVGSEPVDLKRGSYEIQINYITNDNQNTYSVSDKYNSWQAVSGRQGVFLDAEKQGERFPLYTWSGIEGYSVTVQYSGTGWIFVREIVIRETDAWKWVNLTIIVFLCVVLNAILFWRRRNSDNVDLPKKRAVGWIILLLTIFASAPLFSVYLYTGHDLGFHLFRIEGIRESLRSGQIPVRVPFSWLNGYGYAVSVFYGDILLYFPAILRMIGFTVQDAYKIYVIGINFSTALICYYCLYKLLKHRTAALMGSMAYVLAPYRLGCIFVRGAVGEYTAMTFLPLIIYGLYCIYMGDDKKERERGWISVVLGFSGVIQSHIITTVLAGIFAVVFCLLMIRKTLRWNYLKELIKIVIATLTVNMSFLIPFLDYMRYDYQTTNMENYGRTGAQGAYLGQILALFSIGSGYANEVGGDIGSGEELSYAIGGAFLAAGILWYLYRTVYGQKRKADVKLYRIGNYSLGLGMMALFMATIWFPWNYIEQSSGTMAMIVQNIQFPWRALGLASALLAIVLACVVCRVKQRENRGESDALIVALGVLIFITGGYFISNMQQYGNTIRVQEGYDLNSESIGGGEYLPVGTDNEMWHGEQNILMGKNIVVVSDEKSGGMINVTCQNQGNELSYIDVPFLYYKGYAATDISTNQKLKVTSGEGNRVRVELPGNYQGTLKIHFEEPWYWRMSEVVSLVAAVLILGKLYRGHRSRERKV